MRHPELPAGAFIAAVLVLALLPSQWRARNYGMVSLIAWLCVMNLIYGIDSIIWADNVEIVALVWCDITTRIIIGANVAIPACCLSVAVRLEQLASCRHITFSSSQKRRRLVLDLSLCWGIPILTMLLYYTIQGHRFDIFQHAGCRPAPDHILPMVFLLFFPPLLLSAVTFVLMAITLFHLHRRWSRFVKYLGGCAVALTTGSFIRLLVMVVIMMTGGVVFTAINLWLQTRSPFETETDWVEIHYHFSRIRLIPTLFMDTTSFWFTLAWWITPASAYVVFACFSFTEDVMKDYKAAFRWLPFPCIRRRVATQEPSLPKIAGKRREGALLTDNIYPNLVASKLSKTASVTSSNSGIYDYPSPPPSALTRDSQPTHLLGPQVYDPVRSRTSWWWEK